MEEKHIRDICRKHNLNCDRINKITGSFDKEVFNIDDRYLIRTSAQPMSEEQSRFTRIKALEGVPHVIVASEYIAEAGKIYYLILDYIQGKELFTVYKDLGAKSIHDIGIGISDFLTDLHGIKGEKYDIGHYIPIIPNHDKSWREGHELYWNYINNRLMEMQPDKELVKLLELSDEYIKTNISSLDYEEGPVLLHNDFHFKNIIIDNDELSGIIDWECSQFGERDFELIHLLHWSLFPPSKDMDTKDIFNIVFREQMKYKSIPMIEKRLTIYMLEHDFIQIFWSKGSRADEFVSRIHYWLEGKQEEYIRSIIF